MKHYLITSAMIEGEGVFLSYNESGQLVKFDATDNVSPTQVKWLLDNIPLSHDGLDALKKILEASKKNKATIIEVFEDLSFERFWNAYGHKVGSKSRAANQWKSMSDAARVAAIEYIKKYNYRLSQGNIQKQYPTTYLSNKEWEN